MSSLESRLRAAAPPAPPAPPDVAALADDLADDLVDDLVDVAVARHDTPVGPLALAATTAGLVACTFDDPDHLAQRVARAVSPRVLRAPRRLDSARRALDAYFGGRSRVIDVPVDLRLAAGFQRTVLTTLAATTPYGATTTYAELASRAGVPRAVRAVGTALARNPVCLVLPCHRVLRSDGGLGGYAGGLAAKRVLLDLEGAANRPPGALV